MAVAESQSEKKHVKVFISYSHDSPSHKSRVLAFAAALRDHGINVELDQFHEAEIIDWPRWCNEKTSRSHSDFVLCICTAEYRRRIEGSVPPERGKGVYWEGSLLDDDVYDAKGNRRIIPILFDDEPEASIPRFLRGWTYCRLRQFTLADAGYEHLLRILTGQARVVANKLGATPVLPSEPAPDGDSARTVSFRAAPTRLRHGADQLVGREKELARLDAAWDDPKTHVATIVAWGGVGKTALVVDWMARMAADGWRGAERVFDWSFYSQGTREQGAASADPFIAKALEFFGDSEVAKSAASAWDKGARLAHLVAQKRTLLVLDGVEPLQYAPGPMGGKLKDPALEALLKGLAQHNPGLCIVTTRESVADLKPYRVSTAPEWLLEHLSEEAGAYLLFETGVKHAGNAEIRADDEELKAAAREVAGHALTLQLLGRYLAKVHNGDVRKRSLVRFEKADAKVQGGHAFKVMAAYEQWLTEAGEDALRQLAVLRLLGLFDRPADAGCIAALRAEPPIEGLTEPLVALDDDDWNFTLSNLRECGLLATHNDASSATSGLSLITSHLALDCHPLIREYFAQQISKQHPDAWRSAHRRLYEHLCATTKEGDQPTLDDLQPLYQAVAHGCQAGLQQEACDNVYFARIARRNENYSAMKLGALGSDLGAEACFFETPWSRLSPALKEVWQAWMLNEAAFRLRALGRLTEALEPMRAGLPIELKRKDWENTAIRASNLSELELTLGEVAGAVGDASQAVTYADRTGDGFQRKTRRARVADSLHQAGRRDESLALFREAENIHAKADPKYPLLYTLSGFQYCDLLLATSERAAWQTILQLKTQNSELKTAAASCRSVSQRAAQTLKWISDYGRDILSPSLDHLTLGRAALYEGILGESEVRNAKSELEQAVDGLRHANRSDYLPRALLTRAWLRFLAGARTGPESAQTDLDAAWEIAERGTMKLFMADIHLHRARLFRDKAELAQAGEMIRKLGYGRRNEELADAEEAAKNW